MKYILVSVPQRVWPVYRLCALPGASPGRRGRGSACCRRGLPWPRQHLAGAGAQGQRCRESRARLETGLCCRPGAGRGARRRQVTGTAACPRRGSDRPGRPTAWTPRAAPSRRGASAAGQGTGSAGTRPRQREAPRWWPWPRAGRVCRGRRWLSRAGAQRVGLQWQGLWGRARRLGGHPR